MKLNCGSGVLVQNSPPSSKLLINYKNNKSISYNVKSLQNGENKKGCKMYIHFHNEKCKFGAKMTKFRDYYWLENPTSQTVTYSAICFVLSGTDFVAKGLLPSSCMWSERKEKIISNDYKPHYMYYYRLTNWSDKTRTGWTGSPSLPPSLPVKVPLPQKL